MNTDNLAPEYQAAGVNLKAGDAISAFSAKLCQGTYKNSPFVEVMDASGGHFRGPRGYRFKNLPEGYYQVNASDGIGTKVILCSASGRNRDAGPNLLAMFNEDITRFGGMPLVCQNILDTAALCEPLKEGQREEDRDLEKDPLLSAARRAHARLLPRCHRSGYCSPWWRDG